MAFESPVLTGRYVRLEPLSRAHAEGLAAASALDPALYQWTPVPQGCEQAMRYIDAALALRDAGTSVPYATVRIADGVVLGSTRFFDLERWAWPESHVRRMHSTPDVGEIGYTWLSRDGVRTAANTEAKLLMLTQAFEAWGMLRICLHTDARNVRSWTAIERIGARYEGLLRAHRLAVDAIPRESKRYSITAAEWPEVKTKLTERLDRTT